MAASLVGSTATGGSATWTGPTATTNPQSPTAGNTRILVVSAARSTATSFTISVPTSGWVLMGSGAGGPSFYAGCWIFAQIAAGGDTAPSITASTSVTLTWTLEEWSGLSGTLITTGIPVSGQVDTTSSPSLSQSRTSTSANEFQYAALGGRGAAINPAVTWGGGLTADWNTSSGRVAMLKTATGSIAANGGSMTGTATLTNSQGGPVSVMVMAPFALASGGAPPSPIRYKDASGTVVTLNPYYKDPSGTVVALTPKYKDSSGTVI